MKTIEVDPLDITSVNKAITALKAHEVWRKRKITEYLQRLAKVGRDAAEKAYFGGSVNPNHMPSGEEGLRVSVVDTPMASSFEPPGVRSSSWSSVLAYMSKTMSYHSHCR